MIQHLCTALFALGALVAVASLAGDAKRFVRAARDLAQYLNE